MYKIYNTQKKFVSGQQQQDDQTHLGQGKKLGSQGKEEEEEEEAHSSTFLLVCNKDPIVNLTSSVKAFRVKCLLWSFCCFFCTCMQMALCVCVWERERWRTSPQLSWSSNCHSNLVAISSDGFVLQLPVPYNKRTSYSRTSQNEDLMNKLNSLPPNLCMSWNSQVL